MKKFFAIVALMLCGVVTYAQWLGTSPGDLYTTLPVGNVGIGTSTPAWKLHVKNDNDFSALVAESPYSGTSNRAIGIFRMTNTATSEYYNIAFRKAAGVYQCVQTANVAGSGVVNISVFDYTAKSLLYGGNGLTRILLNPTDYVGIGTTIAPPAGVKLAVNGKINCKEIEVTLTGWADHVFNQDYKLRSLYDVENFIAQNKHLPDVPSATEVISKGSNLGEMDAILLQKIEELTLYMIDLKKENDQLKDRLSKIEK